MPDHTTVEPGLVNLNHLSVRDSPDDGSTEAIAALGGSKGVIKVETIKFAMGRTKNGKVALYFLGLSILLCAWAYSLDTSFVFKQDSFTALSLTETAVTSPLLVATRVIFAVSKPILAKISDVSSRPATYVLVLLFYAVGCILIASSTNAVSNIIGQAFVAVGSSGLETLSDIIVGDLTPLKWRGFMWSLLSLPFILNFWLSGIIVHMLSTNEWRWRYGMFAIIMPVVLSPAILIMLFFQKKAAKLVIIEPRKKLPLKRRVWNFLIQMDALGLLIMTLGWTLLLIPFSLYPLVDNGWKNPSLIAMIVVGGVLLIAYVLYEVYIAPVPSA